MLLAYFCTILLFQAAIAQPRSEIALDSLLQDYAFRALVRPKTGIVYQANVPSNLTGIAVEALRLRSGSLRRKGVSYKEFHLPVGVTAQPYVERLVLVYQHLGNWSSSYYSLPGRTFLAPILGLLAYDGSNLSATNLSQLDIRPSADRISITFPAVRAGPGEGELSPKCVHFALDGSVGFENVVNGTTCMSGEQGHYSIVVETVAPRSEKRKGGRRVWMIAAAVLGGVALAAALAVLFVYVRRCQRRKKIRQMEQASEVGVPLPITAVGSTKAPVAMETRTKPLLENEFVP